MNISRGRIFTGRRTFCPYASNHSSGGKEKSVGTSSQKQYEGAFSGIYIFVCYRRVAKNCKKYTWMDLHSQKSENLKEAKHTREQLELSMVQIQPELATTGTSICVTNTVLSLMYVQTNMYMNANKRGRQRKKQRTSEYWRAKREYKGTIRKWLEAVQHYIITMWIKQENGFRSICAKQRTRAHVSQLQFSSLCASRSV